jgi:hypothetical protein
VQGIPIARECGERELIVERERTAGEDSSAHGCPDGTRAW